MPVTRSKKRQRLRVVGAHVHRTYLETGMNATEQFRASPAAKVAPIHIKINQRAGW